MLRAIFCADWSGNSARRAAYVADVPARVVRRAGHGPFALQALLNAAAAYEGEVLVGIDAPFGAPRSLLAATYADLGVAPSATFVEWVRSAAAWPDFLRRAVEGEPWSPLRPFCRIPRGTGTRNLLFDAMRARGVEPLRACDTRTAAKSLFILSGIRALLSAAALLRCVLERTPLGWSGADPFEGGILALDSLNLALPEQALRSRARPVRRGTSASAYTTRQRRT